MNVPDGLAANLAAPVPGRTSLYSLLSMSGGRLTAAFPSSCLRSLPAYSRDSNDLPDSIQSASLDPLAPCANILESGPPSTEMYTWPNEPSPVSQVIVDFAFPPPGGSDSGDALIDAGPVAGAAGDCEARSSFVREHLGQDHEQNEIVPKAPLARSS